MEQGEICSEGASEKQDQTEVAGLRYDRGNVVVAKGTAWHKWELAYTKIQKQRKETSSNLEREDEERSKIQPEAHYHVRKPTGFFLNLQENSRIETQSFIPSCTTHLCLSQRKSIFERAAHSV